MDGTLLCEGGTGRQARFHFYRITPDGILAQIRLNTPDGPLKMEKLTDGLGDLILLREAAAPGTWTETSFTYNDKGQLVQKHVQGGHPRILHYDPLGNPAGQSILTSEEQAIREETLVTLYCHDDFAPGNTDDEEQHPLMYRKIIRAHYNEHGTPITESTAEKISRVDMQEGETQTVTLDKYGQYSVLDTVRDSETGVMAAYSYIPGSPYSMYEKRTNGLLLERKNRSGSLLRYSHESTSAGTIITASDREGRIHTLSTLDRSGRITTSMDSCGATLTRIYDAVTGQIIRDKESSGTSRRFAYDHRGRLISEETEGTVRIQYSYDNADRITQILHLPLPKSGEEIKDLTQQSKTEFHFTYDEASGILTDYSSSPGCIRHYQYDDMGRIHKIITPDNCWTEYLYSRSRPGQIEQISFSDDTTPVRFEYGSRGQVNRITDSSGQHELRYSELMDMESWREALNSTTLFLRRDILGRVCGYQLTRYTDTILSLSLEYDRTGKIGKLVRKGERPFLLAYHQATEQLSGIAYPNGMRMQWIEAGKEHPRHLKYHFPHGESLLFETPQEEYIDTRFEIFQEEDNTTRPAVITTPTGTWQVRRNALSLPIEFRQDNLLIKYQYDYRGRRIEKSIYEREDLVERLRYTYAEDLLLCEFDATDAEHPVLLCSYLWDPVRHQPLGMTLWKNGKETTYYYLLDTRQNIRGLVDADCQLRASYHYTDKGDLLSQNGDLSEINPLRQRSLIHEEELGLSLSLFYPHELELSGTNRNIIPRPPTYFDLSRKSVPELWPTSGINDEQILC